MCELPKNPDATLEVLEAGVRGSPLEFLRKGMVGSSTCGSCRCPPGACEGLLKASTASVGAIVPEDLEGTASAAPRQKNPSRDELVRLVAARFMITPEQARRWVGAYLRKTQGVSDALSP